MASTVLPNGIIIPEKYSRDWYNDLYHNWQELDNLLAGGGANDGTLTIQKNGATVGTFSANQATNETVNITVPDVNDGTLTIQQNGTTVDTFTANASSNVTANITVPTKTSDLTNDSGFITSDDTKIPLAGSNQISGSLIPATDNTYNLGSSSYGYSIIYTTNVYARQILVKYSNLNEPLILGVLSRTGCIYLNHKNQDESLAPVAYRGSINLVTSSTDIRMDLYPNGSLTWSGQPIQYGSDARLKQQISEIDDKLLDAWEDVELSQFKYNDAVEQKGKDKARLHTGYVVQQIDTACKKHGVDVSQYGLYCHEEYPEETEEVEVEQEDGTKVKERKVIREASEHYSLRYTEALVVECKYLRRCIARLTARIEELEKGNNNK